MVGQTQFACGVVLRHDGIESMAYWLSAQVAEMVSRSGMK